MKFLTMCTLKDNISMIPPATIRQLVEASMEWTNQTKKAGKLLEIYSMPDGRNMAICEHPSAEDVVQTLNSMPIAGFMHFETYPLADFNATMKSEIETLKAAEKMFPAREMAGVR